MRSTLALGPGRQTVTWSGVTYTSGGVTQRLLSLPCQFPALAVVLVLVIAAVPCG